jgi:Leucine-rich repeat (LRR) protein
MQGLQNFTKLDLLELYDNMLEALECLEGPGPSLRVLDMSYNEIRDMAPVALCANLQELCK